MSKRRYESRESKDLRTAFLSHDLDREPIELLVRDAANVGEDGVKAVASLPAGALTRKF